MGATGEPSVQGAEAKDEAKSKPISRWLALAITLVAPCIVLLAQQVTLPGIDLGMLPRDLQKGVSFAQFSVVALGIMPFLSAAYIVELVALSVPSFRHLRHGGFDGRAKLGRATVFLGLALTAFQAFSITKWLDALSLFARPGLGSQLLVIMTLVAGVSILHMLAEVVSRRGLASGYGVFWAVLPLFGLVEQMKAVITGEDLVFRSLGLIFVVAVTVIMTWYALESSVINDNPGQTKEAEAPAPRVPFPASGMAPLYLGTALASLPATLASLSPALATIPIGGMDDMTFQGVHVVFILAVTAILTFCFNQPQRMAELLSRGKGKKYRARATAEAYAALRPAMAKSALFLLSLMALSTVAVRKLHLTLSVFEIPLAVALVLDIVEELRARKAMPDLVAVWPEHRPYAIAAAKEALQEAGIPVHARGERMRRLLQFFGPYVPIDLMVPEEHAKTAKKLLKKALLPRERAEETISEQDEKAIQVKPRPLGPRIIGGLVLLPIVVIGLALPYAKVKKERVPTVTLEFIEVDDGNNLFPEEKIRDLRQTGEHPWHVRFQQEQVSVGPGKTKINGYAVLEGEDDEPLAAVRAKLEAWTKTLAVPEGDRLALSRYASYDEEKGEVREVGWRTYLLKGKAVITAADVKSAQAMPDPSSPDREGWLVRLEFHPYGAKKFETYTAEHIKRRFAIVVDGIVISAPVIQTRIPGGIATITMGHASPDQQKKDAQDLARALGGE